MKLFSEFRSCYRPQNTPASTAAPSDNDSHRVLLPASQRSRLRRSHWRPSLSVIMEDSVDQDRHAHTNRDNTNKSQKKLSAKPRSSLEASCSFHTHNRTRNCSMPPVIVIAPFSAPPYMF